MNLNKSIKYRYLIAKDSIEVLLGMRHPLTPPKRYDNINIGANIKIAEEFFGYFKEFGGLKPYHKVLEVGSGFGRMAIPLTTFLCDTGSYVGLEIIKDGVNWCQSNFTPKYPNVTFQHIDVYNERYNPKGKLKASAFEFPFESNSFDFVCLTSVFTHMFADDVEHYVYEISRVLKPGGKCFITYFLLNEETRKEISNNKGTFTFSHQNKDYFVEDISKPEYAIAYNEQYIRQLYQKANISVIEPIHIGSWSGRTNSLSFQDIIIGKKL